MPDEGLVTAFILDGKGGGREVGWNEIAAWTPDDGFLWVALDYSIPQARTWLTEQSGLEEVICDALLAQETRPRSLVNRDGVLVVLRGLNLNPGADPEDMVSVRLWTDAHRVITSSKRRILSLEDVGDAIRRRYGPASPSELLTEIADSLVDRVGDVVGQVDEQMDDLEDAVVSAESHDLRSTLGEVRRVAIQLRRYLAPQRDAVSRLYTERDPWIKEEERGRLREIADRMTRYIEDLDLVRDRATITHEELISRLSEQMERKIFALTLVSVIFLPLTFVTGLLGMNVGGIPWAGSHRGFLIVFLLLLALALVQYFLFRRRRWF
jgi:zinc transporter